MTKGNAPDLEDGFIVNGLEDENSWMTEIQSVLSETVGGKTFRRYLSQECRSENLPFTEGYLGNTDHIFMRQKPVEFLTYTEGQNFFQLPSFDTVLPAAAHADYAKVESGGFFQLREGPGDKWFSDVDCNEREITYLSFEEALSAMQERKVPVRKLFMEIQWSGGQINWSVHTPCRYVNFSTKGVAKNDYLQPISGDILLPISGGGFVSGYVACADNGKQAPIIEFLTRRYGDAFEVLAKRSEQPELEPILEKFSSLISLSTPIYDLVVPVEGTVKFYTYV